MVRSIINYPGFCQLSYPAPPQHFASSEILAKIRIQKSDEVRELGYPGNCSKVLDFLE